MASILFVYCRTSILAAKRNAQKHREADGGQINWHNENLRRHGRLQSPAPQGTLGHLTATMREQVRQDNSFDQETGKTSRESELVRRDESAAEKKLREETGVGIKGH